MAPVLFDFGLFSITGYGFMVAVGILVCSIVVKIEANRLGLQPIVDNFGVFGIALILAAFVGGKIAFVIVSPEEAMQLLRGRGIIGFMREGFVFFGSLIACVPICCVLLWYYSLPIYQSLDAILIGAPLLSAFGRVGCFLAGCCHGCRTDSSLAVVFEHGQALNGIPVVPIQLFEAGAQICIFGVLWFWLRKRGRFAGEVGLTYLILYSFARLVTECFRGDGNFVVYPWGAPHQLGEAPLGLTVAQCTSIIIIVASGFVYTRRVLMAREQNQG